MSPRRRQKPVTMKILIVEDEPHAQVELKRMLKKAAPEAEIAGIADGIESAVEFLQKEKPDLIFMDIQLSDGQSFDIFSKVNVTCPVIFTTAYDAFALQAFKSNGIDYLMKPIEPEAIQKALEKFKMLRNSEESFVVPPLDPEKLRSLLSPGGSGYKTRFMTNIGDRIKFLTEDEIAFFQADDEVVYMVSREKKKFIINYTLENLESQLDPAKFFRINRRYICHIESIGDIHKYFNSRLKLSLSPPPEEEILVSRARVQDFLNWIGQ
jgi:DNA-binding LytR/AlgR family response regulator